VPQFKKKIIEQTFTATYSAKRIYSAAMPGRKAIEGNKENVPGNK
jgi:hypothetical protein